MNSFVIAVGLLTSLPILVSARIPNIRSVFFDNQNLITPLEKSEEGQKDFRYRDWVKISQNAPRVVHVTAGERVEFECEAFGSPSPSVQWSRGSRPQPPIFEESNNIGGIGLGKSISRLIIDCALPFHQDVYTCMASIGTETTSSRSTTLLVHSHGNNLTNAITKCRDNTPKILTWSPMVMETVGNDATLPCRVKGSSSTQLYWIDKNEFPIQNEPDSRFKVLDNGDLIITKLVWSDMGGYTCVVQNSYGRSSETTFLYPLDEESNDKNNYA